MNVHEKFLADRGIFVNTPDPEPIEVQVSDIRIIRKGLDSLMREIHHRSNVWLEARRVDALLAQAEQRSQHLARTGEIIND